MIDITNSTGALIKNPCRICGAEAHTAKYDPGTGTLTFTVASLCPACWDENRRFAEIANPRPWWRKLLERMKR